MTNTLEDDGVCETLESAIICVATSSPLVQAIANMVVEEMKLNAPAAKFVAEQA